MKKLKRKLRILRPRIPAGSTSGNGTGRRPQDVAGQPESSASGASREQSLPMLGDPATARDLATEEGPAAQVDVVTNEPSAQETFDVKDVKDINDLSKLLQHIQTVIDQYEKEGDSRSDLLEAVKINLNPSANFLSRLANVCFPPGGLTRDIATESHTALAKILKGVGNLHWIAAVFSILGSILSRMDQMKVNRRDSLKFLGELSSLGGHVVSLLKNTEKVDNEEKAEIEKKIFDGCSFIAAGVLICFKHLESTSWKRGLLVDTYKKEMEGLKGDINAQFRDLHLFATRQIHGRAMKSYEIVKDIQRKLDENEKVMDSCTDEPEYPQNKVGLEEKVKHVLELLRVKENTSEVESGVQAVLLHGMGGIGKSTLAEAICAKIYDCEPFSKGSFAKVEIGPKASDRIHELQQRMHRNLPLSKRVQKIEHYSQGQKVLGDQFRICPTPILMLIDNVYKTRDLEDLLPDPLCLPSQSRIVVTSRDRAVAETLNSMSISCKRYAVPELDSDQAIQVLQRHIRRPLQIDRKVDCILKKCEGLPLLLEVIGKHVRLRSRDNADLEAVRKHVRLRIRDNEETVWDSIIKRLDEGHNPTGQDDRVDRIFSLSYDEFDEITQELFLDICLLRRHNVDWVRSLDFGLEMDFLEDFSLVKQISEESVQESFYRTWKNDFGLWIEMIDKFGSVHIHDLGASFGLRRSEGARLLLEGGQSVEDKCKHPERVEGLVLNSEESLPAKTLDLIHESLRILVLSGGVFGECHRTPVQLRIFSFSARRGSSGGQNRPALHAFPYKYVQSLKNLRVLEISHSCDCNFENGQLPRQLQILKLNDVSGFRTFHQEAFEECRRSLHTLDIRHCPDFEKLPESFCQLENLVVLVLGGNSRLKSLPANDSQRLESLESVYLDQQFQDFPRGFSNLPKLSELFLKRIARVSISFSELRCLEYLCVDFSRVLKSRSDISKEKWLLRGFGNLHQLRVVHSVRAVGLENLEAGEFSKFTSLRKVILSGCTSLEKLPQGFEDLPALQELDLQRCERLEELPNNFFKLTSLVRLNLSYCKSLKRVPQRFGDFPALRCLNLFGCALLQPTDFSQIPLLKQLDELSLSESKSLIKLPEGFENLSAIRVLSLERCGQLQELPDFSQFISLEKLNLYGCASLEKLPQGFGKFPALQDLSLSGCRRLQQLPEDFSHLTSLENLNISECVRLEILPQGFGSLSALKDLKLSRNPRIQQLPDVVIQLTSLQSLNLSRCTRLEKLPVGFGTLLALKELKLCKNPELQQLPEGFSHLASLEKLNLSECPRLENLPQGFGDLSGLIELNLSGNAGLQQLPESFCHLMSLVWLNLSTCTHLERLPHGFGSLSALKDLNLSGCEGLLQLPESFSHLTSLEKLNLSECPRLENLPQRFGSLLALKDLNLSGCAGLRQLPETFCQLVGLRKAYLKGCISLKELPQGFEDLELLGLISLLGSEPFASDEVANALRNGKRFGKWQNI